MKSVEAASAEILLAFCPIGEELLPLHEALGRHASHEVLAKRPSPAFANSAMDGYAVRAREVASASAESPVRMLVRGESRAGSQLVPTLEPGSAIRIFTGAPLPEGADAVVVQEDTTREGAAVQIRAAAKPEQHVRGVGSDFPGQTPLVARGDRLNPGTLALLASQDIGCVRSFSRPRVAVLCTGDELRDLGAPERPYSIVNSNAYGLAAQIAEAGALPVVLPTVGDDLSQMTAAVRAGLQHDVLLLSGGVSVGDYDVGKQALAEAGVTLGFWKVAMKPGKPLSFGQWGAVPVLGLPGNPVSSWVCFELFVRPGLRKMLGDETPQRPRIKVTLSHPISRKPGRTEFIRARLIQRDNAFIAEPLPRQDSSSLGSLSQVDALVVLPRDQADFDTHRPLVALVLRFPGHAGPLDALEAQSLPT